MPNMNPKRNEMPVQDPNVRNKNFYEVSLGYTPEQAIDEAQRCLQCRHKPCVGQCPVGIDIPGFLKYAAEGDFLGAYKVLRESTALPAVCGRVCPQETQCEGVCVRGIKGESVAIGRLERFIADWYRTTQENKIVRPESNGHKIAVIGAGPTGLTAAGQLAEKGYDVTIYEALHVAGGVLTYGIPEFRLPKSIVEAEIASLEALGVKIETDMVIGRILTIDELFEMGYEAVYIGTGAGLPNFMGIKGEGLNGVYSANEYLTRINLMKTYEENCTTPIRRSKNVAVIGGGNVAMDAARSAKRMGAENVYIVYRRSKEELPARLEEIEHAEEEGIEFKLLCNPIELMEGEKGELAYMKCVEMELGEPDESGRRSPKVKPNSEFIMDIDTVIMSIGTSPNPLIRATTPGLDVNKKGCLITNGKDGLTSRTGVYAGGDVVTGAATVILAMGAGKDAAEAIDRYIMG